MGKNIIYINPSPRRDHTNYTTLVLLAALAIVMALTAIYRVYAMQANAQDSSAQQDAAMAYPKPKTNRVVNMGTQVMVEDLLLDQEDNKVAVGATDEPVVDEVEPVEANMAKLDVPMDYESNTGFKAYMDYRAITSPRSTQYALQQNAYTDPSTGIRIYDGCYMIALGTYYAQQAGERFHITLTSGVEFDAMTGDIKADANMDPMHQHDNGNIVEFIVDTRVISQTCQVMGDMSWAGFEGQIQSIEKI